MGSGAGGIWRKFPKWYSEILRREECKEEDGFVQGLDREGELWGRSMGQGGENGMCKAVWPERVQQCQGW